MTYRERTIPERAALWCPFNDGIDCDSPHCMNCGWNPSVTEDRVRRFRCDADARHREMIAGLREELRLARAENHRLRLRLGEEA